MAMEGSENDQTRLELVEALLQAAPATPESDTESVRLFLAVVRAKDGKFVVPA